jgi:type IV pilus assembly protein PilM
MQLPSFDIPSPKLPSLGIKLGQRKSPELVGLDIQPGYATAVQARVNGGLHIQRAAGVALPGDAMREGEVLDEGTLADALKELFGKSHLDKRVRIGVANQRTVLRMLEMPPLPEGKELAAAVRFQAEDQMPMPLDNAVLDYHPLGIIDTPAGQRQRVAVVAAQRDMIERLLSAVRRAGLRPEAIDLSAFALIRALHRFEAVERDGAEEPTRVLYLNVGGLTNMAIAEGTVCRFTRVVGGGLESMASAIAERHHLPLSKAREILAQIDLSAGPFAAAAPVAPLGEPVVPPADETPTTEMAAISPAEASPGEIQPVEMLPAATSPLEASPVDVSSAEAPFAEAPTSEMTAEPDAGQSVDVRSVVENGIREIANDIRNSLDFHRTQGGGGEVASIVVSGAALAISGFSESLSAELGMQVRRQTIAAVPDTLKDGVSVEHLAVAAGLAVEEAPGR